VTDRHRSLNGGRSVTRARPDEVGRERRVSRLVVTVFGSSRPKPGSPEYRTAYRLGELLAQSGFLVCTGGYGGIMEAASRGAVDAGGETIGVLARILGTDPNRFVTTMIIEESLPGRLMKLIELGDAYVVLRGGTGTLVELAMVWEYMNKHLLKTKPVIIVGDFWYPLVKSMRAQLAREGKGEAARYVLHALSPTACVKTIVRTLRETSL
jgi:uncharacterized protein (TIGR00725 family)